MPGFWRIFYTLLLEITENKPIRNFIWNEGVFLGIVFKWKNMERPRMIFFFWNNNKSIIQILFSLDWLLKFFPIAIVKSRFSPLLSNQPFGEILQSGTNCDS